MKNILAAEFLKLTTTRTVWGFLIAMVAITGLSVAASAAGLGPQVDLESEDGVRAVLHVAGSGAIFVLMLGVIITSGEHRHGTCIDTFLTTPRRDRVLMAKFITSMAAGVIFGALATIVAVVVAVITYSIEGLEFPLGSTVAWQILGGSVVYALLFGGLGASIGSFIRNQLVAIIGTFALFVVAEPMILVISPGVGRWLPAAMGRALVSDPGGEFLSRPAAGALLFLYAAVIMAAAMAIERRRDA